MKLLDVQYISLIALEWLRAGHFGGPSKSSA
jgi:hypothetical protein